MQEYDKSKNSNTGVSGEKSILNSSLMESLETDIISLKEIQDDVEFKKKKNHLLKVVKEYIHLGNQHKDKRIIILQQYIQKIYDIHKKKEKEKQESIFSREKSVTYKQEILLPFNESLGSLHPISKTIRKIYDIMMKLQFEWVDAPEVDYIENIFDKLNMNEFHPAREDQQSFYINNNQEQTLRTHCTNFQGHILPKWNEIDHMRKFHIGKVYRADSDATHTPMFHQFEVFYLSEDANIPTLMGFIDRFFQLFFQRKIDVRIRTSYFPFTCPSYEVDILLEGVWLEIGGCGIVHKNIFALNDKKFSKAWAWGMGIERITMITSGYKDIRNFYKNNISLF